MTEAAYLTKVLDDSEITRERERIKSGELQKTRKENEVEQYVAEDRHVTTNAFSRIMFFSSESEDYCRLATRPQDRFPRPDVALVEPRKKGK